MPSYDFPAYWSWQFTNKGELGYILCKKKVEVDLGSQRLSNWERFFCQNKIQINHSLTVNLAFRGSGFHWFFKKNNKSKVIKNEVGYFFPVSSNLNGLNMDKSPKILEELEKCLKELSFPKHCLFGFHTSFPGCALFLRGFEMIPDWYWPQRVYKTSQGSHENNTPHTEWM